MQILVSFFILSNNFWKCETYREEEGELSYSFRATSCIECLSRSGQGIIELQIWSKYISTFVTRDCSVFFLETYTLRSGFGKWAQNSILSTFKNLKLLNTNQILMYVIRFLRCASWDYFRLPLLPNVQSSSKPSTFWWRAKYRSECQRAMFTSQELW